MKKKRRRLTAEQRARARRRYAEIVETTKDLPALAARRLKEYDARVRARPSKDAARSLRVDGENPLVRRAFEHERALPNGELDRSYIRTNPGWQLEYREWLQSKGINPHTGKTTAAGVAFFKHLVAQQKNAKAA